MEIADNISWKVLQDKVVAVDINTGIYYTMNLSASRIWQAIDEGKNLEAIVAFLQEQYPGKDRSELLADVEEQIEYWKEEKLIV